MHSKRKQCSYLIHFISDNIQKSKAVSTFDYAIPDLKRFSVDATPFTTASSTGFQSTFSRRLTPMSSSPRVTPSTAPSTSN